MEQVLNIMFSGFKKQFNIKEIYIYIHAPLNSQFNELEGLVVLVQLTPEQPPWYIHPFSCALGA